MASYSISTGVKNCKTDKVLFVENDFREYKFDDNDCILFQDNNPMKLIDKALKFCYKNDKCGGFVEDYKGKKNLCFKPVGEKNLPYGFGKKNCYEKESNCKVEDELIKNQYRHDPDLAILLQEEKYINCLWKNFVIKEKSYNENAMNGLNVDLEYQQLVADATAIYNEIDRFLIKVEMYYNKTESQETITLQSNLQKNTGQTEGLQMENITKLFKDLGFKKSNNKKEKKEGFDNYTNENYYNENNRFDYLKKQKNEINDKRNLYQKKLDEINNIKEKTEESLIDYKSVNIRYIIYTIVLVIIIFLALNSIFANDDKMLNQILFVLIFVVIGYYIYDSRIK